MERFKVTIDRSKWLRGEGSEASMLLRESDGKMCCLGQVLLALGKTKQQIAGLEAPGCSRRGEYPAGMGTPLLEPAVYNPHKMVSTTATADAMEANDDMSTDDAYKERYLTPLLASMGIDITFVDKVEATDAGL
jgi:hypothetical protein